MDPPAHTAPSLTSDFRARQYMSIHPRLHRIVTRSRHARIPITPGVSTKRHNTPRRSTAAKSDCTVDPRQQFQFVYNGHEDD
ncbi:hypothetical protein CH275_01490 [Rhodococcus sp. 06-235-1A]|nr:hypothetical protein CH275_01490 [Rhodococcus sp. 06-235-1A]